MLQVAFLGKRTKAILDRILEDWTRHLGHTAAADDTTIVVLKRTGVMS